MPFVLIIECQYMYKKKKKKSFFSFRVNWQVCVEILTNILQMI